MHDAGDRSHAAPPARFRGLDGLRTLAVAMVLVHNYGPLPGLSGHPRFSSLRAGYIGVTIFFVLSGFLITYLLVEEFSLTDSVRLGAFYVRRAFRLFPALLVCLVVLIAISIDGGYPRHDVILATVAVVAYIFNFVAEFVPIAHPLGGAGWGHLWSLSVEEQFYFVWPVMLVFGLRRISQKALAAVLVALALAVSAWRIYLWFDGASFFRLYLLTDTRVDALLIGAALALAMRVMPAINRIAAKQSIWLLPAMAFLVLVADFGSPAETDRSPGWLFGPGMLMVSVISAGLVIVAINATGGLADRLLNARIVSAIGQRSYGIYLFHYPMIAFVSHHRGGWLFALFLTLVLTEVSYRFVEQPFLRRIPAGARRRLTPQVGTPA